VVFLDCNVSYHDWALSINSWEVESTFSSSGTFIYIRVFSIFLNHLLATSTSWSPIKGSHSISLILFTIHTKITTLSVGVVTTRAGCTVGALPMVSITALIICAIKVRSACRARAPIGVAGGGAAVRSCRVFLSTYNTPTYTKNSIITKSSCLISCSLSRSWWHIRCNVN